jgi:hypothetical protein
VESPKAARLGSKFTKQTHEKLIEEAKKWKSPLQDEFDALEISANEAWKLYTQHYCFKCFMPFMICQKREELRDNFTTLEAKLLRMELFSGVRR